MLYEARRRDGDLRGLEFQVEELESSIGERQLSEADEGAAFRGGVLKLLADLTSPSPFNHYEHEYLCGVYEGAIGYEDAPRGDRCRVKMILAHALIGGSLDHWLGEEERAQCLQSAESELHAARQLVIAGGCDELRESLELLEAAHTAVAAGAVSTAVRFDIPIVLPVPDGEYAIRIGEETAHLKVAYRSPTAPRFGSILNEGSVAVPVQPGNSLEWLQLPADHTAKVELPSAKRTTLGFAAVLATFPRYVNPFCYEREELKDIPEFDFFAPPRSFSAVTRDRMRDLQSKRHSDVAQCSVQLVNRFIDHIRSSGERYYLERLILGDVEYFSVVHIVNDKPFFSLTMSEGNGMIVGGSASTYDWVGELRENLVSGREVGLERLLILDARKFLVQGELRLGVLNINAALEAFVNRHFIERMQGVMTDAEIEAFLGGQSVFERCKAALINLSTRGDEVAQEIAARIPLPHVPAEERLKPPVNKMVLEMNRRLTFGTSNSKVGELINRIRRCRNEVAHGQYGDAELSREQVKDSLEALEHFVELATSTLTAARLDAPGEPRRAE